MSHARRTPEAHSASAKRTDPSVRPGADVRSAALASLAAEATTFAAISTTAPTTALTTLTTTQTTTQTTTVPATA